MSVVIWPECASFELSFAQNDAAPFDFQWPETTSWSLLLLRMFLHYHTVVVQGFHRWHNDVWMWWWTDQPASYSLFPKAKRHTKHFCVLLPFLTMRLPIKWIPTVEIGFTSLGKSLARQWTQREGLAQWWEGLPSSNVSRVQFSNSAS